MPGEAGPRGLTPSVSRAPGPLAGTSAHKDGGDIQRERELEVETVPDPTKENSAILREARRASCEGGQRHNAHSLSEGRHRGNLRSEVSSAGVNRVRREMWGETRQTRDNRSTANRSGLNCLVKDVSANLGSRIRKDADKQTWGNCEDCTSGSLLKEIHLHDVTARLWLA